MYTRYTHAPTHTHKYYYLQILKVDVLSTEELFQFPFAASYCHFVPLRFSGKCLYPATITLNETISFSLRVSAAIRCNRGVKKIEKSGSLVCTVSAHVFELCAVLLGPS